MFNLLKISFLLFIVFIAFLASPWYVGIGMGMSMFVFGTNPFENFKKFLKETLIWPILFLRWILK